jgi:hypothetical protein
VSSDTVNEARATFTSQLSSSQLDTVYQNIDKELILCQLEPNNVLTKGQVFLQQVKPNNNLEAFYRRLSIVFNKNRESPYETFQGIKVYTIDTPELPAVLFGGLFKGFRQVMWHFIKISLSMPTTDRYSKIIWWT